MSITKTTKPHYYNAGPMDVIAFCQHHELDGCTFNIIKYLTRRGKKDKSKEIEDLDKAQEYLSRLREYILIKQDELRMP
jgi:hypothetical protein